MEPKARFFELAKKLATKSTHRNHPLGSVLVQKNRVVSVGFNKMKTHTQSNNYFKTTHAEFDAIFGIDQKNTKGGVLYVWRGKKSGEPGMSKPCAFCEQLIRAAGIKGVFYSTDQYPYWKYEIYGK
jgi:deoxycytidylate deaminase